MKRSKTKTVTFAVMDWGKVIRCGFPTAEAAYEWKLIHNINGVVVKVWA